MTSTASPDAWRAVCAVRDLAPATNVTLHVRGHALAVFRTCDGEVFALVDLDPHADPVAAAGALSAGRQASRRDRPVVVSPRTGRTFDLAGGRCLDGGLAATVVPVRVTDGAVEVCVPEPLAA